LGAAGLKGSRKKNPPRKKGAIQRKKSLHPGERPPTQEENKNTEAAKQVMAPLIRGDPKFG